MHAIVSSVGPYRFSTADAGAAVAQALATSAGRGSPQNKLQRKDGNTSGFSAPRRRMNTPVEGTENHTVSSASRMNWPGDISAASGGQQRHAPRSHVTNISNAERSNVMSKVWDRRSVSLMP